MWRLERYASTVGGRQLFTGSQSTRSRTDDGNWTHYSSTAENTIQLVLLEDKILLISCNNEIYESISLWDCKKWLRVISKGDSALFILKNKDENRRFRIKFSSSPKGSSMEACKECLSTLSSFVPVSEMAASSAGSNNEGRGGKGEQHCKMSSQAQLIEEDLRTTSTKKSRATEERNADHPLLAPPASSGLRQHLTMQEIVKVMGDSGSRELGEAYRSTNYPTDQLGSFIRLCLTDSNFPGFVEAVEKELLSIVDN